MIKHSDLSDSDLKRKIKQREIGFGGNIRLKIYGTLQCASGKRMKRENRVFFSSEKQAITSGFRPCGHCMRKAYMEWKTHQYPNKNLQHLFFIINFVFQSTLIYVLIFTL